MPMSLALRARVGGAAARRRTVRYAESALRRRVSADADGHGGRSSAASPIVARSPRRARARGGFAGRGRRACTRAASRRQRRALRRGGGARSRVTATGLDARRRRRAPAAGGPRARLRHQRRARQPRPTVITTEPVPLGDSDQDLADARRRAARRRGRHARHPRRQSRLRRARRSRLRPRARQASPSASTSAPTRTRPRARATWFAPARASARVVGRRRAPTTARSRCMQPLIARCTAAATVAEAPRARSRGDRQPDALSAGARDARRARRRGGAAKRVRRRHARCRAVTPPASTPARIARALDALPPAPPSGAARARLLASPTLLRRPLRQQRVAPRAARADRPS